MPYTAETTFNIGTKNIFAELTETSLKFMTGFFGLSVLEFIRIMNGSC